MCSSAFDSEILMAVLYIKEKIQSIEERLDFQGGAAKDVFSHLARWFQEFDVQKDGRIVLLESFRESFESFSHNSLVQGWPVKEKLLEWQHLVAAARIQAVETQMWNLFHMKLEVKKCERDLLTDSSQDFQMKVELELKIVDKQRKMEKEFEATILPILENCYRPEVEELLEAVDLENASMDFSKPGMFQLYVSNQSFKNLEAYLKMWIENGVFKVAEVMQILQKPLKHIERLQAYPKPDAEFQKTIDAEVWDGLWDIQKLFKGAVN
jgi:hypothetical protein